MRICYISPATDGTGYSQAAIRTMLGLDAAGAYVSVRNVKLANQFIEPPVKITQLENQNKPDNIDVVIQHLLPHMMVYHHGIKNIGYFHCETTNFLASGWQYYLNLMDEIWVSCQQNVEAAQASGVTRPIKVVPIPSAHELYPTNPTPLEIGIGSRYAFYTIGDYSERKNIRNLIKCYFRTFSKCDHVVLVLKTYVENTNAEGSKKILEEEIQAIKKELRRFGFDHYPPVIILPGYLSHEQVWRLQAQCDCFISLERAAAWNLPCFDAMVLDKPVIFTDYGGPTEYRSHGDPNLTYPVKYSMAPVEGMVRCPYQNIYTCDENWADPDVFDVSCYMREVYEKRPTGNNNSLRTHYNLQNAGKRLLESV